MDDELVERLSSALPGDGAKVVFPGLNVSRMSVCKESARGVYEPAFCFVAQGAKEAQLGEEIFRFDPDHYMIYTVDLPLIFRIADATPERPYLGFSLTLDPAVVASVMVESGIKIKHGSEGAKAMNVNAVSPDLRDAITRLVRLIDNPGGQRVLAPLITREIIFRLLEGGQGPRLAHLLSFGDTERVTKAIAHLREHFDQPVAMEEVARTLGMSVSRFHYHFKKRYSDEPAAIPQTDTPPGSAPPDARGSRRRGHRRLSRRLRRPRLFQPRLQKTFRRATAPRRCSSSQ
ncbi:MAG TPA: AraC family transcriptional regulator [Pyrinomonadaceae bacterium]|nr:AraC family transcriptional regulator [Pyrinomonadaceae bacterium]